MVIDEADDGGEGRGGGGDALQRALVGGEEPGVLDQVADAVARDGHLRGDEQIGAARRRHSAMASMTFLVFPSMSPLVGLSWARAMRMGDAACYRTGPTSRHGRAPSVAARGQAVNRELAL